MACGGARDRSHPVCDAFGVDDPELEPPVVRAGVPEHLETTEQASDVPEENATRVSCVPRHAVDLDLRLERLGAEVLGTGPDVGGAAEPILERSVRLLDHRCVEAGAGHDREALTVETPHVECAPLATETDRHRFLDVLRDAQIRGEEIGGAGGQDREWRLGAAHRVDGALHHAVAAPDEEELHAVRKRTFHLFRCEPALRHLDPEGFCGSLALELVPQRRQSTPERLARVCDDRDLAHLEALPAARVTMTSAQSAATPMITPPATSVGWCMPRYIREKAT